jgi:hypothetical protein
MIIGEKKGYSHHILHEFRQIQTDTLCFVVNYTDLEMTLPKTKDLRTKPAQYHQSLVIKFQQDLS